MKNGLRNLCFAVWTVLGLVLIAHELGKTAEAQSPGTPIAGYNINGYDHYVITTNGDMYHHHISDAANTQPLEYTGNFWLGVGPTPTKPQTWSGIKGGAGH